MMSGHRPIKELLNPIMADPRRRARLEEERRAVGAALALARLRDEQGLTQREVAASMEVSQGRVSSIEREGNPELATLRKYAAALGGTLRVSIEFADGRAVPIGGD